MIVVAGGLSLLAVNYAQTSRQPEQASVPSPSPTLTALVAVVPATPKSAGSLQGPQAPTHTPTPVPTDTAVPTPSIAPSPTDIPTPSVVESPTPSPTPLSPAQQTLRTIEQAQVPMRDLYSIAARLKLKTTQPIPHSTNRPPGNYQVGHSDHFYMSDIRAKNYYTITATVKQITAHAYWYAQDNMAVDEQALKSMARTFEQKIYPTDRALFGSEWTPGVDNDPRITVLFATISGAGGYYASADEYTRAVNPFSNEREIIYINTAGGWDGLESTLAHEFQHMIHWHEHPNQDVWLNEGASVLASALNGYDVMGVDGDFMRSPDVQLNAWRENPDLARANYGASFLFLDYLRLHYGGDKISRATISSPGSGTDAIDNALASLGYTDRSTAVFKKWALANLVDGLPGALEKGLDYSDRQVNASPQVILDHYPTGRSGKVSQFGTDYIQLTAPKSGTNTLHVDFTGQPDTPVIAAPAHSGSGIWWSNRGDQADSTMTRSFDLRNLKSATLGYYIWYDIEEDMDYAYVEASSDGGATWDTLKSDHTTDTNPNGNNFGSAYTGKSEDEQGADPNGWLHEQIDLSRYAGKQVMLRFEYITDDGYNAQGLAVDDLSIPELGYKDDAESDTGWQGAGFVRVANKLPQTYYMTLVKFNKNGFDIQPVAVDASGEASFNIDGLKAGGPYTKAVLVIAGLTPDNIQQPTYELSVRPAK